MKYILHHQGTEKGPWSLEEVLSQVEAKAIDWTDYIFDEQKNDWVLLLEHASFTEHFTNWKKPASKPEAPKNPRPEDAAEWYVLRDENKFGPFSYVELVRMLQEKNLFEYDFIWNRTKMDSWKKISEVSEFSPDRIKDLKEEDGLNLKDIFFRRRHARASYGASILLHNNKEVWRGESVEISAGGAGLIIDSSLIEVGQTIFLHFKAGDGVPPFNAVCEVISKKVKNGKHSYGVKFTSVSQTVQQAIQKYANRAA